MRVEERVKMTTVMLRFQPLDKIFFSKCHIELHSKRKAATMNMSGHLNFTWLKMSRWDLLFKFASY